MTAFSVKKKQISHYTYYCHLMEGETPCSGSRLSDNVTTACICVVTEWKWVSLKKKKKKKKKSFFFFFFLGRLPLLPWSHLGRNFGPLGRLFRPSPPLAWSPFNPKIIQIYNPENYNPKTKGGQYICVTQKSWNYLWCILPPSNCQLHFASPNKTI